MSAWDFSKWAFWDPKKQITLPRPPPVSIDLPSLPQAQRQHRTKAKRKHREKLPEERLTANNVCRVAVRVSSERSPV